MTAVAVDTGSWAAEFAKLDPAEPWIERLRQAAFERFSELGFPTTHDEEWRFTNVAPIARAAFRVAPADSLTCAPEAAEELDPRDVQAHLAQYASFREDAFVALNTAFLNHQAPVRVFRVPRGVVLEQPIEVAHEVAGDVAVHPRTLVLVGEHAQCTIVETYKGHGTYFTNTVTEIVADAGAVVDHYKIQTEAPGAFHVATMQVALGRRANFSSHSISLGGALVRNDANVTLSEGAEATLNGLYVVSGTQHVDNHTAIDHAQPHGTSHELYKGILDGRSTAVFNGRILVRKDAQKTDSKQTNKNLVLSDDAVIDTKPELQIFADDVRCTHGATIGQLDAEAMFYLRSRGIGREEARGVLTFAFAQDIVDRIKLPNLRESLERLLLEKLHEHAH